MHDLSLLVLHALVVLSVVVSVEVQRELRVGRETEVEV